jgi:SagB-type dehydrogenase family enzyme
MKTKPAQEKTKNKVQWLIPLVTGLVLIALVGGTLYLKKNTKQQVIQRESTPVDTKAANIISLPKPVTRSSVSIESSLNTRRTKRAFVDQSIPLSTVSQMLWAAQGVTAEWGGRTAPSAKSTYPLTVYLVANKVDGLTPGQYVYVPGDRTPVHGIKPIKEGNFGDALFANFNQNSFKDVPAIIVITGDMAKMAAAFGGVPNDKDVYLEAGHAAQNMYLIAESLKIGMVTNTSDKDTILRNIITIPDTETIIYLIPFGIPKK